MISANSLEVTVTINGRPRELSVCAGETLLHTLRDELGLIGTKESCVEGECGACTVLLDDEPVDSCLIATATLDGRSVRTVEGLSRGGELGQIQQAFLDHGAVQCGFCTPGLLMTLTALVEHNPSPNPVEIREAITGNICRCTGYSQIVNAVVAATTHEESQ